MRAQKSTFLAGLLLVLVSAGGVVGQVPSRATGTARDSAVVRPPNPDTAETVSTDTSVPALLDAPVSRVDYRLGPGDMLGISLFGALNRQYSLPVMPEGTVVIPSVGVVDVRGLNLDQAEARVRDAILRYYRNVDVRLNLASVRRFKVYLLGAVRSPGARQATAVTRVSELVPVPRDSVTRRNVLLRRANGDSVMVDLVRFRQTGDLRANPTLQEGDVIFLPALDQTVDVTGTVSYPGTYEYRRGESLAELLRVANGGREFPSSAADSVQLVRFVQGTGGGPAREFLSLSRAEAVGPRGEQLAVQPFDAIYVPQVANFRRQSSVVIQGQVLHPGTYPIRPDTTTVGEIIRLAGGLTPEASLFGATLRRDTTGLVNRGLSRIENVPQEILSREERRILQIESQGDPREVAVDFQALLSTGRSPYDQPLQPGDTITIPQRRNEVLVLGAVARPGLVPFTPGQGASHFVGLAGGFTGRSDRHGLVVLRAQTGARASAHEVRSLDPGDAVIVPYAERPSLLQVLQTTSVIASSITSLALAYLTLFR